MEHDTQSTKRTAHTGTARDSVSRDVWHDDSTPSDSAVPTGRPTGATGGDASEFSDEYRDASEQIGTSRNYEDFSRRLDRLESSVKALTRTLAKAFDVDESAFDDDEEDEEESEEKSASSKSFDIHSMSVNEMLATVMGRQTVRTPPDMRKGNSAAPSDLESGFENLSGPHQIIAKSLLSQALAVREGSFTQFHFEQQLKKAPLEVRLLFQR